MAGMMEDLWNEWGTIWFLEQFGLWANQPPGIKLGYPKMTNFAALQGRSVSLPRIDDEVAGFIHDSINELGERNPLHREVLILFYVRRKSFERTARETGLKRTKATEVIRTAEAWIDCKLNDYFKLTSAQRIVMMQLLRTGS